MKRGQVVIRGVTPDGSEGLVDVMDLDEDSFRAFFVELLSRLTGFGTRKRPEDLPGDEIRMRHRNAPKEGPSEERTTEDVKVVATESGNAAESGEVARQAKRASSVR